MFKLLGFLRDDACTPQSAASLSALNHTVDHISRADVIFKISIEPHYFNLTVKIEGENPMVLIEIYLIDVFHSVIGQDCLALLK